MHGRMQDEFKHEVLEMHPYEGPRINLTFREIVEHRCRTPANVVIDISKSIRDLQSGIIKFFKS